MTNKLSPVEVQSFKMNIFQYKMKTLKSTWVCHSFTVVLSVIYSLLIFSARDLQYDEFIYEFGSEARKLCPNKNSTQSDLVHLSCLRGEEFLSPWVPRCCTAVEFSVIPALQAGTISPGAKGWPTPVPSLALSLHWVLLLFWAGIPEQPCTEGNKARCSLCSPRTKHSPGKAQGNQSCCSGNSGKEPAVKCGDGEGRAVIWEGGKTQNVQATQENIMKCYKENWWAQHTMTWRGFFKGVNNPEKQSPPVNSKENEARQAEVEKIF